MRRFYSHYTFIYPDRYLKNAVIEVDGANRISNYFPFEKEIANTEFYSGILFFLPQDIPLTFDILSRSKELVKSNSSNNCQIIDIANITYNIYTETKEKL